MKEFQARIGMLVHPPPDKILSPISPSPRKNEPLGLGAKEKEVEKLWDGFDNEEKYFIDG